MEEHGVLTIRVVRVSILQTIYVDFWLLFKIEKNIIWLLKIEI